MLPTTLRDWQAQTRLRGYCSQCSASGTRRRPLLSELVSRARHPDDVAVGTRHVDIQWMSGSWAQSENVRAYGVPSDLAIRRASPTSSCVDITVLRSALVDQGAEIGTTLSPPDPTDTAGWLILPFDDDPSTTGDGDAASRQRAAWIH